MVVSLVGDKPGPRRVH